MLEEAAPMLANFNGKKSLATSTDSFNSLFEVDVPEHDSDTEYSTEDEEQAEQFLETV